MTINAGAMLRDVVEQIEKGEHLKEQEKSRQQHQEIGEKIPQQVEIEKLREAASAASSAHVRVVAAV